jgi:gliding motility-associated-like protein
LVLSTPEATPFDVQIKDGSGTLIRTVQISNATAFTYSIGSTNDTYTLVPQTELHKALKNRGLVIEAEKKFYAYFRAHATSQNQAADLTCKGRAALGKVFRVGHLLQESASSSSRSNFVGVLATEDSTIVTFSEFDRATKFMKSSGETTSTGTESLILQKGESLVFSQYLATSNAAQPPNGFMGGLLEANKPIAVNVGSWTGSPVTSTDQDVGIDQIAPFENVGTEYIINRANGSDRLERPMVVAHISGTRVFLNGNNTPSATLNAGQTFIVPASNFTADNNLHIKASEPVFVYQMIGGAAAGTQNELRTEGLVFVPPISCSIANSIDNIVDVNQIGAMSFNGGVMLTAMRDSQVTVRMNGATVNLGNPFTVQGNPDFVTYRNLNVYSTSTRVQNLSVVAQGSVQVALYGQNNAASYAAFYSGFSKSKRPKVELVNLGDGVCPDTLVARGLFDGVQWVYEDSIIKFGKDTLLVVSAPGPYIVEGYLGVCRRSETARDTLEVSFRSPEFPYQVKEPTCFGLANGTIQISRPSGGYPPYQYSIDNGRTFFRSGSFNNIAANDYKLVVKDSLGCYNRPLSIKVKQPVPFTVRILPDSLPEPFAEGKLVNLSAQTNRKIVAATWLPKDTTGCVNCLTYVIRAKEKVNVVLSVRDSMGCLAMDTITIFVQPSVFAPNVFNPQSVVGNHAFTLFSKERLPIRRLHIYNRWGDLVFKAENTETNVLEQGWDGTYNGQPAHPAVYVFWAEVEVLPNRIVRIAGDVTVLR